MKASLLLLPLFLFIISFNSAAAFSGGTGSPGDPYQITTCQHLQDISLDDSASYVLAGDVDCAVSATWNANTDEWLDGVVGGTLIDDSYFGVTNNGYFGFVPVVLDGGSLTSAPGAPAGGYTISNLWIFRKDQTNVGIFAQASNASITNITIDNARVVGGASTGILAGVVNSSSTIANITVTDSMVRAYRELNGGGIAGQVSTSTFSNIIINDTVVHGSGNIIGGIAGVFDASVITNATLSNLALDGGYDIGGAFGAITHATASAITITGIVHSRDEGGFTKDNNRVGGLAGRAEAAVISNSSFTGTVFVEETSPNFEITSIGGFIGLMNDGSVTNSFARATSTDAQLVIVEAAAQNINDVGGFVGEATYTDSSLVENQISYLNSYTLGRITINNANSVEDVGGFGGEYWFYRLR